MVLAHGEGIRVLPGVGCGWLWTWGCMRPGHLWVQRGCTRPEGRPWCKELFACRMSSGGGGVERQIVVVAAMVREKMIRFMMRVR